MDSTFFWYRIWLKLPNDLRQHLDEQQALADSGIYVSFSLSVSTFLMALYSIVSMWGYHAFQPSEIYTPIWLYTLLYFGMSVSLWLAAYIIYRLSLQVQAQFGELFKATFDQFGLDQPFGNVPKNIDRISLHQKIDYSDLVEKNMALWRYLHNFRVRLPWNDSLIPVSQWNSHLEDRNPQGDSKSHLKVDEFCQELEDLPSAVVICSGAHSHGKHCQITIAFSKSGKATCPYCGTQFFLGAD